MATTLKEQFEMNSVAIGSLGSMAYLGATLGSLIAIPVLDKVPSRWAIIGCLLF